MAEGPCPAFVSRPHLGLSAASRLGTHQRPGLRTGAFQKPAVRVSEPARFAILAIVARLHPVAAWICDHETPPFSIEAIPPLRATFSVLPLERPSAFAFACPCAGRR